MQLHFEMICQFFNNIKQCSHFKQNFKSDGGGQGRQRSSNFISIEISDLAHVVIISSCNNISYIFYENQ